MATFSYTSRRQAIEQSFPFAVMVIAPLVAIFLQAYVPLRFPRLAILDLPLIVTLYFLPGAAQPDLRRSAGYRDRSAAGRIDPPTAWHQRHL